MHLLWWMLILSRLSDWTDGFVFIRPERYTGRSNHVPSSLYHLLDCDMHHVGNLHERTYAHIGKAQLINFFVIGECPKVGFHNQ